MERQKEKKVFEEKREENKKGKWDVQYSTSVHCLVNFYSLKEKR